MTDLAFNLIMDCGQAMLANGGEVFRAQDTMEIMARSFGIVDFHVYVLTNGIFASAQNGTVSAVRHVPAVSTNLGHVEAINAISRRVADGELQGRALVGGDAQLGDLPLQRGGTLHLRRALGGRRHAGDLEVGADHLVDDDVRRAGLGDVGRQVAEQVLQVRRVRGDGHVRGVRIGGPVVQCTDIQTI